MRIQKPMQSPVKPKPAKRKLKSLSYKSPVKRDGDIRALFSAVTKSTKNYTKLLSDLGVKDDGTLPTSLINLLVDLSLDNSDNTTKCYICETICDCNLIKKIRNHNSEVNVPLIFFKELNLPEVDLIDDMNVNCLKTYAELDKSVESQRDFNKTNNFNLEIDFDALSDLEIPEGDIENIGNETENLNISDNNFDIGSIDDIFVNSSPEEALEIPAAIKDTPKDALGFFGLESIDDIFADDDDLQSPEHVKIEQSKNIDKKNEILPYSNCPLSPSILSGNIHKEVPTSPILCSQMRQRQHTDKKKQSTSTPLINDRFVSVNNPVDKFDSKTVSNISSNKLETTNDKSMFTITQLINMINKPDNSNKIEETGITSGDFINRSASPILLSHTKSKKNAIIVNNTLKRTDSSTDSFRKSESLIILESDSDSADTLEYDLEEAQKEADIVLNKDNVKPITVKRSLSEYKQETTASPFFCKKQKIEETDKKPLTIQEKVLAAVKSNKFLSQNFKNDQTTFNVKVTPPKFISQKENKNPYVFESKCLDKRDEELKLQNINILDNLKVFKRDSKVKSPKKVFDNIINSPLKTKRPGKRKLLFEDSDDDFEETSLKSPKIPRSNYNSNTTNHKTRKVSIIFI